MYRWLWDHLPGPTAAKASVASLLAAAVIAFLVLVAMPALQSNPQLPTSDGSGSDQDQVIEPDGVRQSTIAPPTDVTPTPSVPEDAVPQQ